MKNRFYQNIGDFKCSHCHAIVSFAHVLSGVNNRNHCPYCLWSKHLDLNRAGDRLCACKGKMRPIGLTLKKTGKKYGSAAAGELMIIHQCTECGQVSINRIAADDEAQTLYRLVDTENALDPSSKAQLEASGIRVLTLADATAVSTQLFGQSEPLYFDLQVYEPM